MTRSRSKKCKKTVIIEQCDASTSSASCSSSSSSSSASAEADAETLVNELEWEMVRAIAKAAELAEDAEAFRRAEMVVKFEDEIAHAAEFAAALSIADDADFAAAEAFARCG